jgi:hypothetical protein
MVQNPNNLRLDFFSRLETQKKKKKRESNWITTKKDDQRRRRKVFWLLSRFDGLFPIKSTFVFTF